jgi:hypothetical protein
MQKYNQKKLKYAGASGTLNVSLDTGIPKTTEIFSITVMIGGINPFADILYPALFTEI